VFSPHRARRSSRWRARASRRRWRLHAPNRMQPASSRETEVTHLTEKSQQAGMWYGRDVVWRACVAKAWVWSVFRCCVRCDAHRGSAPYSWSQSLGQGQRPLPAVGGRRKRNVLERFLEFIPSLSRYIIDVILIRMGETKRRGRFSPRR
jgi:hypothetical protein